MNKTDAAYAAGIIDGEGSISCSLAGYPRQLPLLFIAIGMTTEKVPRWFYENFGGHLNTYQRKKGGFNYHWETHGKECRKVLETTQPYAKLKGEHVQVALAFVETVKERGVRGKGLSSRELVLKYRLANKLRALNGTKPIY